MMLAHERQRGVPVHNWILGLKNRKERRDAEAQHSCASASHGLCVVTAPGIMSCCHEQRSRKPHAKVGGGREIDSVRSGSSSGLRHILSPSRFPKLLHLLHSYRQSTSYGGRH